jgi:multidrug resistance efflux pump
MSLVSVAREALKELPLSDIVRDRFNLALDQLTACERKTTELQLQIGRLHAQKERAEADLKECQAAYERLKELHMEEVQIQCTVELRKGERTGN